MEKNTCPVLMCCHCCHKKAVTMCHLSPLLIRFCQRLVFAAVAMEYGVSSRLVVMEFKNRLSLQLQILRIAVAFKYVIPE